MYEEIPLFFIDFIFNESFICTKTWIGVSGGSWSTAANWSPSGEPTGTDAVIIDGFSGTINFTTPNAGGTIFPVASLSVINSSNVVFANNAGNNGRSLEIRQNAGTSVIESGSTLTFNSVNTGTGASFQLQFNTSTPHNLNVNGTLVFQGNGNNTRIAPTGSVTTINGTLRNQAANGNPSASSITNLIFGAGSTFEIAKNGGSIPTATWNSNSTILVSGTVATAPTHLSSTTYGNLVWNCPSQSAASNPNFTGGVIFAGNAEIRNTNGTNFRFATNTNIQINGNLIVGNTVPVGSAILDVASSTGNGTINVRGDVDVKTNGTITETGSSTGSALIFSGTSAQNFNNAGTLSNTLIYRINNSNNVSLLSNVTIPSSSSLDLTTGMLLMGNNNLIIGGPLLNGSSASFIVVNGSGSVTRNNVTAASLFPVGTSAASYSPVTINNTSGYNWTVNVVSGVNPAPDPGFNSDKAVLRTWNITPSTNPAVSATTLTFQWNEANSGITGVSYSAAEDVSLWRHNGAYWLLVPLSTQAASGSAGGVRTIVVNRPGPAQFSPFAISNVTGPLPTRIVTFNAVKKSGYNLLHFEADCSTAYSEFEIQRSIDGRNFKTIQQFTATKDRCRLPFDIKDESFLKGKNYYRIKMTDANGEVSFSFVALVMNTGTTIEIINLQPTITNGAAILNISSSAKTKIELTVLAADGRIMIRKPAELTEGANQLPLNVSALPADIYYIRGTNAAGITNTIQFIKQ